MSFTKNNPYYQHIAGSSLGQDALEQMKNALSQRDQLIAQLMQQAEDEDEEQNNPWGSSNNKGKGHSIPLQDNTANCSLPSSSRAKPLEKTRRTQTPTPYHTQSVKRNPIQMLMQDAPPRLQVYKALVGDAYTRSNTIGTRQTVTEGIRPAIFKRQRGTKCCTKLSRFKLINEAQVQTLHDSCSGKRKTGKNIINVQEFYITYVHAMLAKLGIHIWAPDLEEAPNYLYNKACCIVSLMKFQQISCSGAYQYMRTNLTYCNYLGLLCTEYDHYVHYVLAEKYKKENREKGLNAQDVERKVVQRARQRLHDHRYKFLVAHKYTKRYQVIASNVNAHSDDEYNTKTGLYIIKALPYRSENATAFFQRLDSKMAENHSEKSVAADLSAVDFVPVKNLPPGSKEHPEERLGDISFNYKYWESTIKDYEINPRTPDESESQSVGSSLDDNSIDLNAATGERDVDNNLLEKEIIESGKGETKLLEEEKDVAIKNCEDVVMLDAWDSRLARGNWRMNNYYYDLWK
ncbi:hypothetical protein O181_077835 [Austropuccinia psidii MF-1]|uniref:Uncharacterized protein n=1 Tax=Austropuccinia psidii MF-1 TaxID=1389203 RepID=A0A9Q3IGD1_9BASI|nr:hypothetical protein [Austropuccinia psidii MF-1]